MATAAAGFLLGSTPLLLAVLFGLGVQATFFGPLKYAILPQHLPEAELVAGNGLIEAGTFLGILAGTIAGTAAVRPAAWRRRWCRARVWPWRSPAWRVPR